MLLPYSFTKFISFILLLSQFPKNLFRVSTGGNNFRVLNSRKRTSTGSTGRKFSTKNEFLQKKKKNVPYLILMEMPPYIQHWDIISQPFRSLNIDVEDRYVEHFSDLIIFGERICYVLTRLWSQIKNSGLRDDFRAQNK